MSLTNLTREQLIEQERPKIEKRIAEMRTLLEALNGEHGQYLVYTGGTDCPVYVTFNENLTAVLSNIGITRATRFARFLTARRMALTVRNGHNEVGHAMSERDAYMCEIANLEQLLNWFNTDHAKLAKEKLAA